MSKEEKAYSEGDRPHSTQRPLCPRVCGCGCVQAHSHPLCPISVVSAPSPLPLPHPHQDRGALLVNSQCAGKTELWCMACTGKSKIPAPRLGPLGVGLPRLLDRCASWPFFEGGDRMPLTSQEGRDIKESPVSKGNRQLSLPPPHSRRPEIRGDYIGKWSFPPSFPWSPSHPILPTGRGKAPQ